MKLTLWPYHRRPFGAVASWYKIFRWVSAVRAAAAHILLVALFSQSPLPAAVTPMQTAKLEEK